MFELNLKNIKNYTVKSTKDVYEQDLHIVELVHNKTKARVLLFITDDENRVFNIAFKTPVTNSKGIPHILEHSVLCGSRKYNVKDPFMELAKSSLNTFLNALTYDDKTCYPVASANLKDFHNLVDVYLDAVFYPNAVNDERFFMQEGWHYEINDKNEPLVVNGVVYNEMRGVFSDPDSLLEYSIEETMFPSTNYMYISGGNPIDIIDLSYEEFVEFHKKYYSASNSIIYYYGKLDFNEELEYLHNEYLSKQEYVEVDSNVSYVKDFVKDIEVVKEYNLETNEDCDKSYIAYSFALDKNKNTLESIVIEILDYILFSSDGAIIREKCQNAGLGEEISTSINVELVQGLYSIVAKNINIDKKEAFKNIIIDSVNELIKNGIEKNKIKAALNLIYFNYAEGEYGNAPKGLNLILASLDSYLYSDVYDTYMIYKEAFDFLNSVDLNEKNNIFIKTLKKVFIDNNHRCINILNPSSTFVVEKDEHLTKKLDAIKKSMSDVDIENVIKKCKELKEFQKLEDTKEALTCIPKLDITDIERDKNFYKYEIEKTAGVDILKCCDNDKDIAYLQLYFDVSSYSKEELSLLSMLTYLIGKINLKDEDYHKFSEYVDMNTGGFSPSLSSTEKKVLFSYEIKVTTANIDKAFNIFYKVMRNIIFEDKDRISILINENKVRAITTLLSNGHIASMQRANSDYSFSSFAFDKVNIGAVGFNMFIDTLSKVYGDNYIEINRLFDNIYKKTIMQNATFCYSINEKYECDLKNQIKEFIDKMSKDIKSSIDLVEIEKSIKTGITETSAYIKYDEFDKKVKKEAIITPNEINFCGLAAPYDDDRYIGRLKILKVLFSYEYLWTNIRVLGGAYGCMFNIFKTGTYVFASYRDPNLSKTNSVFFGVKNYLKNFDKSDEEIKKYIISTMGTIDNPLTMFARFKRNISGYFTEYNDNMVNEERHNILDTKAEDIKGLYRIFDNIDKDSSMCALITESKINEAKSEYDSVWKIIN